MERRKRRRRGEDKTEEHNLIVVKRINQQCKTKQATGAREARRRKEGWKDEVERWMDENGEDTKEGREREMRERDE